MVATAQGFAGLGTDATGFAEPSRGDVPSFPADQGAHTDFRIEWWYVTANLTGDDGIDYGVQWTLFRTALAPTDAPDWDSSQVWMGHAALTTPSEHYFAEKLSRGGVGTAGVTADPFDAWIDDWQLVAADDGYRMTARPGPVSFDLALTTFGPRVLHGEDGFSVKSPSGQASHYYSEPFLAVSGDILLDSGPVRVTGLAWLDREWSSQPLGDDQSGWDWFSLSFDDGSKLMAFWLRSDTGRYSSGTWIAADGTPTAIGDGVMTALPIEAESVAGQAIPTAWRLTYPPQALDVTIKALNHGAWNAGLYPYWEGPVSVTGSHIGLGYLEMTGYDN